MGLHTTIDSKPVCHVIPLSSITHIAVPSLDTPPAPTPLPPLNMAALQARANAAVEREKEKARRTNKDVSKEAQEIFDALYRQFPGTRWAGKDMVVLDAVLIRGPGYRVEDCGANGKEGAGALARVKKVVSCAFTILIATESHLKMDPSPLLTTPLDGSSSKTNVAASSNEKTNPLNPSFPPSPRSPPLLAVVREREVERPTVMPWIQEWWLRTSQALHDYVKKGKWTQSRSLGSQCSAMDLIRQLSWLRLSRADQPVTEGK